jgi:hypothetical protein
VLESSGEQILQRVVDDALVLDVGGWGQPFPRADWVLDLLPHETRGLYGYDRATAVERFTADTWVQRDICDREPWPFADGQFDFAICSHTLEDVRDPIWVCHELQRVATAGYIETPSRAEEQSWGVHGEWVGWSHHRWLVDVVDGRLRFAFKPAVLHARDHFPAGHAAALADRERVVTFWWEGSFEVEEVQFVEPEELHRYLRAVEGQPEPPEPPPASAAAPRSRSSLQRALRAARRPRAGGGGP